MWEIADVCVLLLWPLSGWVKSIQILLDDGLPCDVLDAGAVLFMLVFVAPVIGPFAWLV